MESPWPEGEALLQKLFARFEFDFIPIREGFQDFIDDPTVIPSSIQMLKDAISTFPISSADCERGFSTMNMILSVRNRLVIDNSSDLLFLALIEPPVYKFNPQPYVESWVLKSHRNSDHQRSRRANLSAQDSRYKSLWPLL